MANFDVALARTLQFEGWYDNHPKDAGGETFRGIARNFHSQWPGWAEIDRAKTEPNFPENLRSNEALAALVGEFYKQTFWDPARLDLVASEAIAAEIFDTSVLNGLGLAVRIAQGALIILNSSVDLDGRMGPQTIAALNTYHDLTALLTVMNGLQFTALLLGSQNLQSLVDLIKRRKETLQRVMRGWSKRVR